MPGATRVPGMTRRLAATLTSVVLLATPSAASAADTTPPRVSGVTLSGAVGSKTSACVYFNSSPLHALPVVTLRLSEPATVTVTPLPLLGRVGFGPGSSVSVSLPAGPSTLQFSFRGGVFDAGTVPLAPEFFGEGAAAVLVTARDAAGNRTRLPTVSNPTIFGVSGGYGRASERWPCDAGPTQQARLNVYLTGLLVRLLGG